MSTPKRSIFEDVSADTPKVTAQPGGIDRKSRGARGAIRAWLMVLFAMVVMMIAVGGLTRLTDSGLSITEWKPVTGAIPPMSEEQWLIEFEKYKQIPEYQLQNKGMSLSEFKFIFWWEWGHRQLGRTIGLVWAVGFFAFWALGKIPTGWTGRLVFIGALGGLQGAVGWWMVHSGLSGERLDVASYRLATHLGLAFVILGFIAWYVFQLGQSERDLMQRRRLADQGALRASHVLIALGFVQIIWGALVAGIDAGRNYIDWPWMAGGFTPPGMWDYEPIWRNFFENDGTVQFVHRIIGYILFAALIVVWQRTRRSANGQVRFAFALAFAVGLLQMTLGIVTVMYSAPWQIAIIHQLGAVFLWVVLIRAKFMSGYPPEQSIRG